MVSKYGHITAGRSDGNCGISRWYLCEGADLVADSVKMVAEQGAMGYAQFLGQARSPWRASYCAVQGKSELSPDLYPIKGVSSLRPHYFAYKYFGKRI